MSWGVTTMRAGAALAAFLALAPVATAATDEHCIVPAFLVEPLAQLPRATIAAKRDRKLEILLISGSPSQTGAAKGLRSYPSVFEDALRQRLPGLDIHLVVRAAPRRSVADTLPKLSEMLAEFQPALVIWQAGTADAYLGVEADDFADTLRRGIATVLKSGADAVIVDMQYSPRTDRLIDTPNYLAQMRWLAETMDVPLFSRYEIMRYWSDSGAFDLTSLKNDGLFEKVHMCIGNLLADFVARGASLDEFKGTGR
ncbi:MAG: SGNH/GDSL hydrolase family protein [Xanthobacteraceae bacterium]